MLKDPYVFDFLSLTPEHSERELDTTLVAHITQFLLELGAGFAYVGRQVPLQVSERDFFLDLLLYHTRLALLYRGGTQDGGLRARVCRQA